jgi:hypothetical protein
MKKKINNYRFQQQQQAKIRYQKVKKVKETIKEKPENVTEELDYIKKLLNGEDVGNFGPEEPVVTETNDLSWMSGNYWSSMPTLPPQMSKLSLSEILDMTESKTIIKRRRK